MTSTVRCVVRLMMRNARPIGAGRTRFIACLKKHLGAGVRICLWDPSVTPCTEKSGSVRSHDLVPTVE